MNIEQYSHCYRLEFSWRSGSIEHIPYLLYPRLQPELQSLKPNPRLFALTHIHQIYYCRCNHLSVQRTNTTEHYSLKLCAPPTKPRMQYNNGFQDDEQIFKMCLKSSKKLLQVGKISISKHFNVNKFAWSYHHLRG